MSERRAVAGFEGFYEVSRDGFVYSVKTGRARSNRGLAGSGYVKLDLWGGGKKKQTYLHRVVAEAFCNAGGPEVNHKDGNKLNNHADNLEWVTRSENERHSRDVLGNLCKPVAAIDNASGVVRAWPSVEAAVRDGFHPAHIYLVLDKPCRTHRGLRWFRPATTIIGVAKRV